MAAGRNCIPGAKALTQTIMLACLLLLLALSVAGWEHSGLNSDYGTLRSLEAAS